MAEEICSPTLPLKQKENTGYFICTNDQYLPAVRSVSFSRSCNIDDARPVKETF